MAASAPKTNNVKPAEGALLLWQTLSLLSRVQMRRLATLFRDLDRALVERTPCQWTQLERVTSGRLLRQVGVVLMTKRDLAWQRHEVKRGERPAVRAFFGAPVSDYQDLYILDVQTRLIRKPLHAQPSTPND